MPPASASATVQPTTAPPTSAASASPASGRIAFIRETLPQSDGIDVFIVDADGSNLQQVTKDARDRIETDLFWVRDGSRLIVVWENPGNPYLQFLASIKPDGSDRIELGSVQTAYSPPTISPDGRSVAFGGDGDTAGNTGVVLLDLDTGQRRPLMLNGSTDAKWSADGSRIVAYLPSRQVGIVAVATGEVLFKVEADVAELVGWAADDESILFVACPDQMNAEQCMDAPVLIAGPAHAVPIVAQDLPARVVGVPSPDGAWLASLAATCEHTIRRMTDVREIDIRSANRIEFGCTGGTSGATWSPDSQWLARSQSDGTRFGAAIALVSPLDDVVAITSGARDGHPAWQPR